ncbi:MAG: peptide chain release factor N(5)-glutamine methyltransferase [Prevotella sp.]|nr:peptide chain release factor N(5)-glutamine methyltransferase [Prevotella sp.]
MSSPVSFSYQQLWHRLVPLYEAGEARAVVRTLLTDGYGLSLADVLSGGLDHLPAERAAALEQQMQRLERAEPVQQVLGFAWFCGRRYSVTRDVLTPRPETEELCRWIALDMSQQPSPVVADVGTGSGCIACTLALDLAGAAVTAIDVSAAALGVARANAASLGARLRLVEADVLSPASADANMLAPASCHVVVSNPPYIALGERAAMHRNVLDYEPHQALFVPDDDPLLFYRAIASHARRWLRPGGRLYFELNPQHATATARLLDELGYDDVELRRDACGRQRMASARLE